MTGLKEAKEFDKYEDGLSDVGEVNFREAKIHPDFYIHTTELKIQQALIKDDVKDGFLQYVVLVEHMEMLCDAAGRLPKTFKQDITSLKDSREYLEREGEVRAVWLAKEKLRIIYRQVFSGKTITNPLRF